MCTVTFVPTSANSFLLTSNRDEYRLRPTLPPQLYEWNGEILCFPKDQQAGGTWIVTHPQFTLCLLNGAFETHVRKESYRQSRGKILLDFFEYRSVNLFLQNYRWEGIEPFTLLLIEHNHKQLTEVRWDETEQLHVRTLPTNVAHIWSSATLYAASVRQLRQKWFEAWLLEYTQPTVTSIIQFHRFGGNGDSSNDLVMNRANIVQTLSTTCIDFVPHQHHTVYYREYLQPTLLEQHLPIAL
ncbi:MAG: NRDE family protein [Chitinophagales bacterium]|nr:NRDE family protein [Chitinophagales bacterium]